jgi:hypothetical protein
MKNLKFIKCGALVILTAISIVGCDAFSSEPTYGGLSVEGLNYTPFNLSEFVIRDKYGNRASGGGDLPPSAGAGSVSCCYKLKGTDFTVEWDVYDADEAIKDIYAPIKKIHKVSVVHMPAVRRSAQAGDDVLAVHFYPDDHVEFEFRSDFSGTRIDYTEVDHWFQTTYGKAANPDDLDLFAAYRRTARVAAQGWIKYRFTDPVDLEQYVYYTLLINARFDEHPAISKIIQQTKDHPGAFGAAMQHLSDPLVLELKSNRFKHLTKGEKND